jgi:hypothetical protein
MVYGGRDVLSRVGSRWGGLGVAETVEGMRGEAVEGVSVFITYPFFAGSVLR